MVAHIEMPRPRGQLMTESGVKERLFIEYCNISNGNDFVMISERLTA